MDLAATGDHQFFLEAETLSQLAFPLNVFDVQIAESTSQDCGSSDLRLHLLRNLKKYPIGHINPVFVCVSFYYCYPLCAGWQEDS